MLTACIRINYVMLLTQLRTEIFIPIYSILILNMVVFYIYGTKHADMIYLMANAAKNEIKE